MFPQVASKEDQIMNSRIVAVVGLIAICFVGLVAFRYPAPAKPVPSANVDLEVTLKVVDRHGFAAPGPVWLRIQVPGTGHKYTSSAITLDHNGGGSYVFNVRDADYATLQEKGTQMCSIRSSEALWLGDLRSTFFTDSRDGVAAFLERVPLKRDGTLLLVATLNEAPAYGRVLISGAHGPISLHVKEAAAAGGVHRSGTQLKFDGGIGVPSDDFMMYSWSTSNGCALQITDSESEVIATTFWPRRGIANLEIIDFVKTNVDVDENVHFGAHRAVFFAVEDYAPSTQAQLHSAAASMKHIRENALAKSRLHDGHGSFRSESSALVVEVWALGSNVGSSDAWVLLDSKVRPTSHQDLTMTFD